MKYIITEDRLNDLITKYLNSIDWWVWDVEDGEFDLSDGYDGKVRIKYRLYFGVDPNMDGYESIYITHKFVNSLSNIFTIGHYDIVNSVIQWFNKRYNKNLTIKDFGWFSDDENEN